MNNRRTTTLVVFGLFVISALFIALALFGIEPISRWLKRLFRLTVLAGGHGGGSVRNGSSSWFYFEHGA